MTPKEKAEELFKKYRPYADGIIVADIVNATKQCALIAVDEIINHHSQEQGLYRIDTYYWQQVKQEIEKPTKQTALQELIAWGDNMLLNHPQNTLSFGEAIDKAVELLEKEKEQINKAYYDGYYQEGFYDARKYYDDTYDTDYLTDWDVTLNDGLEDE